MLKTLFFQCLKKVTEYLNSGVFFLQEKFDFLTSNFDGNFLDLSKNLVVMSLNLESYFTCDHFCDVMEV